MLNDAADRHSFAKVPRGSRPFARPEAVAEMVRSGGLDLRLARTIEREVIPRLLLNTSANADVGADVRRRAVEAQNSREVVAFCDIVLTKDLSDAVAYLEQKLMFGASLNGILVDLFAPTARRLGELWESDACSFTEVTIALGRLQQILHLFSQSDRDEPESKKLGFTALLATVPSNQHVFGLCIVEELFRRAGWNVLSLPSPSRDELLDTLRREWFAVVGFSIGCDDSAQTLAPLIADVRATSRNRSVLVLVGGRYVVDNPDKARALGADLLGTDVEDLIERSQAFLTLPAIGFAFQRSVDGSQATHHRGASFRHHA